MHDVLVIVFDSRAKAERGKTQLLQMGNAGTVSVYGYALVAKKEDGTAVVELDEPGSLGPFAKSIIGTLRDATRPDYGSKSKADLDKSRSTVSDMIEVLLPNRVAIVTDVEEEWPPVLDTCMEHDAKKNEDSHNE